MYMDKILFAERIKSSRKGLYNNLPTLSQRKLEAEGGCGVVGFACSEQIAGWNISVPLTQMHNRGNGKGGGVVAVGLTPTQMGVSRDILENHYLIQVAYLDHSARKEVENKCIRPFFEVHKSYLVPTVADYQDVVRLEIKPPDVWRYFCRVKKDVLLRFIKENGLDELELRQAEDEFIYQNTVRLNKHFYSSLGKKQAFVLCHGRNLLVFKIVGYAEQVIQYYRLDDVKAHIWVGHQRYPTKGRVWHPGGAHPFIGLNEALVHNGDFANYYAVSEYLQQHNINPLFLTDTEISVQLFDLWDRIYGYPLEYIIEAMAPTTERDFIMLPEDKKKIYRAIQTTHIHGSPDGPWFFIIARNKPDIDTMQLLGITDTAMLRPQVFALQQGEVDIGLIASEKQAIDATLRNLAGEDPRFCPVADRYWNARGGSHTDGGAFSFTLADNGKNNNGKKLTCTDKFGKLITASDPRKHHNISTLNLGLPLTKTKFLNSIEKKVEKYFESKKPDKFFNWVVPNLKKWSYDEFMQFCTYIAQFALINEEKMAFSIETLTMLFDRRYDTGIKKHSSCLALLDETLYTTLRNTQQEKGQCEIPGRYCYIDWDRRSFIQKPTREHVVLVVNAREFPPEGDNCLERFIIEAYKIGWKRFIVFALVGQRFCGCGLGPGTEDVRIDIYGSSGDYLGSGLDGAKVIVHGSAQDQLGQILKDGKLVIHGDVGQTFLYGAKGGEIYVLGNAAGRPLINAVGHPRVVINGTCLDYLAESFMAGDALRGGGFVILNGIEFDECGNIRELPTPYPGGNLFSLASGGAIYLRDPHRVVDENQLNGGQFIDATDEDWSLILPYLEENERLFGISIEELLTVEGHKRKPLEIYRKIEPIQLAALV
ncbi:MAG: glutamate synthase [Candidatus Thermoplasmatota archaeon]|nr:glutamate synthase [Candidatus Thermoplasmatota archaeon]